MQIFVEFEEFTLPGVAEVWTEPWLTLKYDSVAARMSMRIDVTDEWLNSAYEILDQAMDHYGI